MTGMDPDATIMHGGILEEQGKELSENGDEVLNR